MAWIATMGYMRYYYRDWIENKPEHVEELLLEDEWAAVKDLSMMNRTLAALGLTIVTFSVHEIIHLELEISAIALGGAGLAIGLSLPDLPEVVERVEWPALLFFAGLFIMVGGLEAVGHLTALASWIFDTFAEDPLMLAVAVIFNGQPRLFDGQAVGSSTMAQKQNPIACENLGGLARMVRSFTAPALENNLQWHERDLANSSSERMLLPHFYILIDEMLCKAVEIFHNVQPNQERIAANLGTAGGLPMAEAVLLALTRAGMDRQAAHELVRQVSMQAATGKASFRDLLLAEGKIAKLMTAAEIDEALDPANYVGHAGEIVDRVLASLA
jgi:hypothetical protein